MDNEYIFTDYKQYLDYVINHANVLTNKQISKFNALCNKMLNKHGIKKKYTNADVCKAFKEFCDNVGIKDYYVY